MIKVIAFDFDGVLADTVAIKDQAFYDMFIGYGENAATEALRFHKNRPGVFRKDKILGIFSEIIKVEISERELESYLEKFAVRVKEKIISAPLMEGVKQLLQKKPFMPSYIVSAAPEDELQEIVEHKGGADYFKGIFGGPNKKSLLLQYILKIEHILPKELLFIGDSISDYNASNDAGTEFVGFVKKDNANPFPENVHTISNMVDLQSTIIQIGTSK